MENGFHIGLLYEYLPFTFFSRSFPSLTKKKIALFFFLFYKPLSLLLSCDEYEDEDDNDDDDVRTDDVVKTFLLFIFFVYSCSCRGFVYFFFMLAVQRSRKEIQTLGTSKREKKKKGEQINEEMNEI